jgi:hypothetical protein
MKGECVAISYGRAEGKKHLEYLGAKQAARLAGDLYELVRGKRQTFTVLSEVRQFSAWEADGYRVEMTWVCK